MRVFKLFTIVFCITVSVAVCRIYADEDSYFSLSLMFRMGSESYSESQFEDAIEKYEKVIERGYESPRLYYNLGNAYFKAGDLGNAILNYERAKRLMPRDSDLTSNLKYAYSIAEEPPMDRTRIWLGRKIRDILDSFTISGLTKLLSMIYLTALLLLTLLIFKKYFRKFILNTVVLLALIFMMVLTVLSVNIYRTQHLRTSIIVVKEINARFEPLQDATVHFKLYAGSRVIPIKTKGDWSQIKREDGKVGWVESYSYEVI